MSRYLDVTDDQFREVSEYAKREADKQLPDNCGIKVYAQRVWEIFWKEFDRRYRIPDEYA